MQFRVATWPGDADFPLNLMIDDLADVYVDQPGMSSKEKDWGHLLDKPGSAWTFVTQKLLDRWPELKLSLFIPVNRQPVSRVAAGASYYGAIDKRPEMVEFLRSIDSHPRVECAYHGKDHFREHNGDWVQEWLSFDTVSEAMDEISHGLEIFERVFQRQPLGGKYPGYASRDTSMDSIIGSGFRWWCSSFNRGQVQAVDQEPRKLAHRFLGESDCLDLPSTMAGNVLLPFLKEEWIKWPKRVLQNYLLRRVPEVQIKQLSDHRLPLTLQEHIAPSRADGKRQRNNLQDDRRSLYHILTLVRNYQVWNAHLTEIADHLLLRERTVLEQRGDELLVQAPSCAMLDRLELFVENLNSSNLRLQDIAGRSYPANRVRRGHLIRLPLGSAHYRICEA
jgi:hypothetical protein